MNRKTQNQKGSNRTSRSCGSSASASRTIKTIFNNSPNLSGFIFQKTASNAHYKKCPQVNKNQANNSNRNKTRPVSRTSGSLKKQETTQVIYKQCGHLANNVAQNNKNLSTGPGNKTPQTPKNSANVKLVTVEKKNNIMQVKVSELPQVHEKTEVPNKSTTGQMRTSEINNQDVTGKTIKKETIVQPTNKNKNTNSPPSVGTRPTTPQQQKVTELYKRKEPALNSKELVATSTLVKSKPQNTGNLSFQKVTQDLANIIKNFQRQIHNVPLSTVVAEQVPSAILRPKVKEFFTNSPKDRNQQSIENENIQSNNKGQQSQNSSINKKHNANVHKRSSLKSLSSNMSTCQAPIRRFSSFTHHNLTLSTSSSNKINRLSALSIDPLKQLKDEVQKAIRERRTFTVRGHFAPIRKALLARGWVEKLHPSYKDHVNQEVKRYMNYTISELLPLLRKEDLTSTCKTLIKSKLLGGYQVDFYWGTNDDAFKENPDKIKYTIINKLKREIFSYTNKQGLCDASKLSYWYQKSNVSKLNHPRSYSLGKNGDLRGFMEDFHVTAAMSVLKWVVKIDSTKECKLVSPFGQIPLEVFDFALNECCKFIKKGRHEDIDMLIPEAKDLEWSKFLEYFYKLVHYNNHFKEEGTETEDSLVRKSNYILNNLRTFYPYVDMDGSMNIWILKPTASSRGRGIHMCRTLQYVLKIIKQNQNIRYIIQKYIERPLLIYNTKFDIRQWFLISNCSPLTIWMYKECYLRFSSQTYNLRKLHESIHLTNNSVQCKYMNHYSDAALPSYNMWDSAQFQTYLANIGYPNAFKDIIYPGMKQCITAAVMMHQDKMVVRRNCFELYGADFILTEDFQPWLLEINSNPALFASTPVTGRMCPKVLEDVIKVVIDYAHNAKANTGGFQLIYRENPQKLPQTGALELKGMPLRRSYFFNAPDQELNDSFAISNSVTVEHSKESLKVFGEEIKKTLKDLLEIIQNEKQKRGLMCHQQANFAPTVSVK